MGLVSYARDELMRAGVFDKDSDYDGMLGEATLKVVEAFADEGHSGCSAAFSLSMLKRLLRFKPLSPIKQPVVGDYVEVMDDTFQHCRDSDVFSSDGGRTWYTLTDEYSTWWKPWTWGRDGRRAISFPYWPK